MSNKSTDQTKGGAGTAQSDADRAAADQAAADKKKRDEDDAAAEAAKRKAAKDADAGLVTVTKGGQSLKVHATCVASHVAAGWKVAE